MPLLVLDPVAFDIQGDHQSSERNQRRLLQTFKYKIRKTNNCEYNCDRKNSIMKVLGKGFLKITFLFQKQTWIKTSRCSKYGVHFYKVLAGRWVGGGGGDGLVIFGNGTRVPFFSMFAYVFQFRFRGASYIYIACLFVAIYTSSPTVWVGVSESKVWQHRSVYLKLGTPLRCNKILLSPIWPIKALINSVISPSTSHFRIPSATWGRKLAFIFMKNRYKISGKSLGTHPVKLVFLLSWIIASSPPPYPTVNRHILLYFNIDWRGKWDL